MRFVPLNRGGLRDDHGTDGYVMKRPGEVAIRAGYTDLVISYDGERLSVASYFAGDLEDVWSKFEHSDKEILSWATDDQANSDDEAHDAFRKGGGEFGQ